MILKNFVHDNIRNTYRLPLPSLAHVSTNPKIPAVPNSLYPQLLGLSLDESDGGGLIADDKTLSVTDKAKLINLYTDLFMDYANLILGVFR